jgi:hypothetical protein
MKLSGLWTEPNLVPAPPLKLVDLGFAFEVEN